MRTFACLPPASGFLVFSSAISATDGCHITVWINILATVEHCWLFQLCLVFQLTWLDDPSWHSHTYIPYHTITLHYITYIHTHDLSWNHLAAKCNFLSPSIYGSSPVDLPQLQRPKQDEFRSFNLGLSLGAWWSWAPARVAHTLATEVGWHQPSSAAARSAEHWR